MFPSGLVYRQLSQRRYTKSTGFTEAYISAERLAASEALEARLPLVTCRSLTDAPVHSIDKSILWVRVNRAGHN